MPNHSATVLITGAGTVTCQSVIKGLRSQEDIDVTIVTVDASGRVAGRYFSDAFYTVPPAAAPDFCDVLLAICGRHHVDLLIPIVDYEFAPISAAIDRFQEIGCAVGISPVHVVDAVNDKVQTYRFFLDNHFPTAHTWTADEAREAVSTLPYPVFLKPALDGRSSIDCYRVETPDNLLTLLDRVENPLVQEYIDAPEYTVDLLADWSSVLVGAVPRQRIETKGGVSYKGVTIEDPALVGEIERMVRLLGIVGPANIQYFHRDGRYWFNEINPRFSGALALSLAAGFNSPLELVKLAVGIPRPERVLTGIPGVTMLRYWDEVFLSPSGEPIFPEYRLHPRAVSIT